MNETARNTVQDRARQGGQRMGARSDAPILLGYGMRRNSPGTVAIVRSSVT